MKKLKTLFFTLILMLSFSGLIKAQIISQYIETDGGNNPKGIEIWNNTGTTLDFSTNTLDILKGANGGTPSSKVTVATGTLAAGEVMVIGTSDLGIYLTSRGLTSVTFEDNTFTFNGDDALVVKYGGVETDVFGTVGVDPGSDWSGNGVSTKDQNIELNTGITTGSTGFTDPSTRFSTVSTTPSGTGGKAGFGIAPPSGNAATKLAVLTTNSGDKPTLGTGFEVTVQAQDASGNPTNVSSDTDITLTKATGSGTLGGTLTGTISNGSNLVTISGVTYDQAESGISITASDDASGLSSGTSTTFEVLSAPTKLVIKDFPTTGAVDEAVTSFTVEVQRADNSVDKNSTASIAIKKASGPGNLTATSPITAVSGIATFNDVTFDATGDYTVQVSSSGLSDGVSPTITLSAPDIVEKFDNYPETSGSYESGSFTGVDGSTWNYVNARGTPKIDGPTPGLQNNSDASLNATISGGISSFSFDYMQLFGTDVNLEVYINDELVETVTSNNEKNTVKNSGSVNVNVIGNAEIEFKQGSGSGQVGIDNLVIYSNPGIAINITGTEGWRMLSTPTSDNTYDDLLGPLWTQGIPTGADVTGGVANVKTYNGSSFTGINDMEGTMTPGQGFITYIYSDDDYTNSPADAGFPKTLSLSGDENTGTVTPSLNSGAGAWSLVGNPYASTIEWDLLTKTGITETVYVYDHSYGTPSGDDKEASNSAGSYRVWNNNAGSLAGGKIAAFQGFWVQNASSGTPGLTIEEADKSSGGTSFYKETSRQPVTIKLKGEMDYRQSEAFLSFTDNGLEAKDNFDGLKLAPLDFKDYLSVATLAGDTHLDINNLPQDFERELEIPLSVQAFQADAESGVWKQDGGTLMLSWPVMENIPGDWALTLHDYSTGTSVDMKITDSYTFTLKEKKGAQKAMPSTTILQPQPPTVEQSRRKGDSPRFTITVTRGKTSSTQPNDQPEQFALEQNYPNPFNPSTRIQYSVQESGPVTLTVYNVMGQQVETLVSKAQSAGTYRVNWNAANMASGIYYYRLQAGNQITTRQMTLIK